MAAQGHANYGVYEIDVSDGMCCAHARADPAPQPLALLWLQRAQSPMSRGMARAAGYPWGWTRLLDLPAACTGTTYRSIYNYLNSNLLLVTCDTHGFLYLSSQSNFSAFVLVNTTTYGATIVKLADFSDGPSGARATTAVLAWPGWLCSSSRCFRSKAAGRARA